MPVQTSILPASLEQVPKDTLAGWGHQQKLRPRQCLVKEKLGHLWVQEEGDEH